MGIGNFIAKKVILPLTFLTVALAITNTVQAQTQDANNNKAALIDIIENAYGGLVINSSEGGGVSGAEVIFTPVELPGDSIPDPYNYITDNSGVINYEILISAQLGVGTQENPIDLEVTQVRPNPSRDFTFNYISKDFPQNQLIISDIRGRTIKTIKAQNHTDNVATFYTGLSDQANGIYLANMIIDGSVYSNKIIKINGAISGSLGSSAKQTGFKDLETVLETEAIYELSVTADGYEDFAEERTYTVGDQGWSGAELTPVAGLPNSHDIAGTLVNGDDGYSTVSGAIVNLTDLTSGEFFSTTTDANGDYIFHDLPLLHDLSIEFGGIDDLYSFRNITYTTPNEIQDASDTINDHFDVILKYKLASSSANHIKSHT